MDSVELRQAGVEDADVLLPMVEAFHRHEGIVLDAAARRTAVAALFGENPFGRIWLAFDGELVVGYVAVCFGYTIEFGGRDAFLDELYIKDEYRGRGLGKAVLEAAALGAAKHEVKVLHLEVASKNLRAQQLYASSGFAPLPRFLMSRHLAHDVDVDVDVDAVAGERSSQERDGSARSGAAEIPR